MLQVIKHILISAEKTGAVPLISNDEIDQAIEVLRSARKPSKDGGDEESKNASSTNATTNGTSGPVSAAVNGTSSSATGAIQVPGKEQWIAIERCVVFSFRRFV